MEASTEAEESSEMKGLMRLLITTLWLGGGVFGFYTFFKYRGYVQSLPASSGNDKLKRQFKARLLYSFLSIALGIWWAIRFFK
jgi:hypothetical protein